MGKQFGELYQYNLTASFKDEDAPRADETVKAVLEDKSRVTDYLMTYQESGDLYAGNKTTEATLYVPESTSRLPDFIVMRERKSGKAVPFDGSGVLLTEKQAEALGVKAGDTLRVRNADGKSGEFRLAGIIENYVQGALYIPRELYEAALRCAGVHHPHRPDGGKHPGPTGTRYPPRCSSPTRCRAPCSPTTSRALSRTW